MKRGREMDEMNDVELSGPIVATSEPSSTDAAIAELDQRIRELEAAIGDLRTVKAESALGRKTVVASSAFVKSDACVDEALGSLSVEQRIAVKSGLMRAGLI
jgi:hypothetical protein